MLKTRHMVAAMVGALCSLTSSTLWAQSTSQKKTQHKSLTATEAQQQIVAATQKISSIECDFVQTKHMSLLGDQMVSEGKLWYSMADNLRWQYTKPYAYTFVISKGKVLIDQGTRKDVMSVSENKLFREISRIMVSSVTGECLSNSADFDVSLHEVSSTTMGLHWAATLTPKRKEMKQAFETITLHFDAQSLTVSMIEMTERRGDKTEIELKNIRTNGTIDSSVFNVGK